MNAALFRIQTLLPEGTVLLRNEKFRMADRSAGTCSCGDSALRKRACPSDSEPVPEGICQR